MKESGDFSWNSGMFIWSSKSIVKSFETNMLNIHELFRGRFKVTARKDDFINEIYNNGEYLLYAILESR